MSLTRMVLKGDEGLRFFGAFLLEGEEVERPVAPENKEELRFMLSGLPIDSLLAFAEYIGGDDEFFAAVDRRDSQSIIRLLCRDIPDDLVSSVIFGETSREVCFLSETVKGA